MSSEETKDEFRPKCAVGVPCTWLERHLEPEPNSRTKGMHLVECYSLKSHKRRSIGIAFRTKPHGRPLMLNFCPFCGTDINWNEWTKAAVAADESYEAPNA